MIWLLVFKLCCRVGILVFIIFMGVIICYLLFIFLSDLFCWVVRLFGLW